MKKIIYTTLTALLLAVLFAACEKKPEAKGSVRGSVVASGEPINAATILLTPGGGVKITGSDGLYEFPDLQPGRYDLKVFKEGYVSTNRSIDIVSGKNEELVITLSKDAGNLTFNKSYIDMGSNPSNNMAGFSIVNSGSSELAWSITNAAPWITKVDPSSGTVPENSSIAVVITIDRSRLSSTSSDNHATLVARSTTAGDGSAAELLVTVFGTGDGTNIMISNEDYVFIDGLVVQTRDLGGLMNWTSAVATCQASRIGGYNDWYLPDIGELSTLYTRRDVIGGFNNTFFGSWYWSSSPDPTWSGYYLRTDFYNGHTTADGGYLSAMVRCVRKPTPLPVVSTLSVTNVTTTAATLNGRIDNAGTPPFTERGFVYSNTFQNPTIDDDPSATTKHIVSGTSEDFSANIAGLTAGTLYRVRAYATNSNGTAYGESVVIADYVVLQSDGILVQKNDISSSATWTEASSLCSASTVGGLTGWRLPTYGELQVLYNNRTTIGGFSTSASSSSWYWSGTPADGDHTSYISIHFSSGEIQGYYSDAYQLRVRCVRNMP